MPNWPGWLRASYDGRRGRSEGPRAAVGASLTWRPGRRTARCLLGRHIAATMEGSSRSGASRCREVAQLPVRTWSRARVPIDAVTPDRGRGPFGAAEPEVTAEVSLWSQIPDTAARLAVVTGDAAARPHGVMRRRGARGWGPAQALGERPGSGSAEPPRTRALHGQWLYFGVLRAGMGHPPAPARDRPRPTGDRASMSSQKVRPTHARRLSRQVLP